MAVLSAAQANVPCAAGVSRKPTHGAPASHNAHPHFSPTEDNARIALVHNGIIENHDELRATLRAQGYAPPTTDQLVRVGLTGSGDGWTVDGEKMFVTNGSKADSYVVSTVAADPSAPAGEFSCVVVPADAKGLSFHGSWNGVGGTDRLMPKTNRPLVRCRSSLDSVCQLTR